jgi:23S rRNA (guanosine2251-2'-O)-methyltransferase
MIIEGNVSVKAAVMGGKRKVARILVDEAKNDKDTSWILHRAEEKDISIEKVKREAIDSMAEGRTHGGLIAETEGRIFDHEEDCMKGNDTFAVILEGVEDPFNLGYIMRSLYAAGCTGILLRNRNWASSESTILKSSAGAFDRMNVVMSDDLAESMVSFAEKGVKTYAAMRKDAVTLYEADFSGPVLLAIGGEMRGLSSAVRKNVSQNIYIPYANDFHNALNAAGASAVLGFEVYRQRNMKG